MLAATQGSLPQSHVHDAERCCICCICRAMYGHSGLQREISVLGWLDFRLGLGNVPGCTAAASPYVWLGATSTDHPGPLVIQIMISGPCDRQAGFAPEIRRSS